MKKKSKAKSKSAKAVARPKVQSKAALAMAMKSSAPASFAPKMIPQTEQQMTPFSWLSVLFVLYFLAQSVIVYLAAMAFPSMVVLGTDSVSATMALVYSMGALALLVISALPIIEVSAKASNVRLSDMHWMIIYLVINAFSLWVIARFAEILGLGLSSWMVVAALAFVINAAQGLITTQVMGWMKK